MNDKIKIITILSFILEKLIKKETGLIITIQTGLIPGENKLSDIIEY